MLIPFALLAAALLVSQPVVQLPPADDISEARAWLSHAQLLSFDTQREYCGYLGRTVDGEIAATEMIRGGHNGCTPILSEPEFKLSASMHTHGAYDPKVPAEFPTTLDIASDAREGVNGFISTPGGRLWFIDSARGVTIQLCGPGCLPQDPAFRAGDDGVIRRTYTTRQLRRLELAQ